MSPEQISTSRTMLAQSKQDVCISVKVIRVNLPSKRFRLKSKVSLRAGGVFVYKSFYAQSDNQLDWTLKSPMVIPRGKDIDVSWKPTGTSMPKIETTLSYDSIIKHLLDSNNNEFKFHHERGDITVTFEVNDIVELARKRKSIISRLGVSVHVLENVLKFSDAIGEIHPAVKLSFSCLSGLLDILKQLDAENNDVLDLATNVSDIVDFTFAMRGVETISQLTSTIGELRELFDEVNELVTKRANRGHYKEIKSVLMSEDRGVIERLNTNMKRYKQNFDRGLLVQNVVDIKTLLQQFALTREDEEFLHKLERTSKVKSIAKRCHEGTREDVLQTLLEWVNDLLVLSILWIRGYPGAGKSTVASHFAEDLRRLHRLCIIFAFNRNDSTSPIDLWCAIAYELACRYHVCRETIISKLKNGKFSLTNATAQDIFQELVIASLRGLAQSLKDFSRDCFPVFVIDALDECGGLSSTSSALAARKEVIAQITQWFELVPEFKLVVTSRPESDIEQVFSHPPFYPVDIHTGEAHGQRSIEDVMKYVKYRFDNMTIELRPPDWPGEDSIHDLAYRSGGIFIWAVTALDFIEEFDPVGRLRSVQSGDASLGGVDALYRQILETSFSDEGAVTDFVTLMSAVTVSQSGLSPSDYASLLGLDVHRVYSICGKLRSVLDTEIVLQVKHASFVDFLVGGNASPHGAKGLWGDGHCRVNPEDGHGLLAKSAFRIMNERLRFNICDVGSSFVPNAAIGITNFRRAIGPTLVYACQFWGYHLENSSVSIDLTTITTFMRIKLLPWLEAMSGLGQSYFAFRSLNVLGEWLGKADYGRELDISRDETRALVLDSSKFSQYFAPAMARSAAHVYVSAIPFAPQNSKVSRLYAPKFQNMIAVQLGRLSDWPPDTEWNVFRGHDSPVYSVALSPDGKHVASGSADDTIRVWDLETRRTVAGPFKLDGRTKGVLSVAYSPDGRRIVSGYYDGIVRIWDIDTGETVGGPLVGHDSPIKSVTYTLDGKYVISSSDDGTIRIWDVRTCSCVLGPLREHEDAVLCIATSPDGKYFASGSRDGTILIWEIESGTVARGPFKGHRGGVRAICYSPNGELVVSGSYDKTIRMWDVRTGQTVAGPFTGHQGPITSVVFTPNGESWHLVSGSWDKTIRVWDVETGHTIAGTFSTHKERVMSVTSSVDGKYILSGSFDGTIRIWEVGRGNTELVACNRNGGPDRPTAGTAGRGSGASGMVRVWDVKVNEFRSRRVGGHENAVFSVAFSPDSTRIASGSTDSTIRIWDVESGSMTVDPFRVDWSVVHSVAFSPDGKHVASGSSNGEVRIWEVRTGRVVVGPMLGHGDSILSVEFSPDGELVVSGSGDKTIRVWNAKTGTLQAGPFTGHEDQVSSVAFSRDGKFVVSGSDDKTVRIWNVKIGQMVLGTLTGHSDQVTCVAFSPCGKYVASGSEDHTIRIWNSQTGEKIGGALTGHTGAVMSVNYSPNGKYVVSGSDDRTIRVWDVNTGETVLGPLNGHSAEVNSVAFSPDGNRIASCSEDKTIRIWEIGLCKWKQGTSASTDLPVSNRGGSLFTDRCRRDKDGWVIGENGELLFWIPPHNTCLRWPSNSRTIGDGETEIDCDDVYWGERWANCYKQ